MKTVAFEKKRKNADNKTVGEVLEPVMKPHTTWRTAYALPAVLAFVCSAATAADLPSRKAPPVEPPPPVFTWTGFYIGMNYGYAAKGSSDIRIGGVPMFDMSLANVWPGAAATGATGVVSGRLNGFFGGAQIGYNKQFANGVIAGVEADIQGGGINGGGGFGSLVAATAPGSTALTSVSMHRALQHFGTVRGRIGYSVTPTLFGYITGGLAYGGTSLTARVNQALNPSLLATGNASASKFAERVGWTIGAGAEMALTSNLSAKLEYLYYDLGSVTATFPNFGPLVQNGVGAVATGLAQQSRFNGHIFRTGLNYRFGGQSDDGSILPAFAFIGAEPPRFGDWQVSITPYMWGVGLNGTSTTLGNTASTNMSFVGVLTNSSSFPLEAAANIELRNGPLSFYADLLWARMQFAGSISGARNPVFNAVVAANAEARLKQTIAIVEGGVTYEVTRWGYGGSPYAFTAIDAVAGARLWRIGIDLKLDLAASAALPGVGLSQTGFRSISGSGTMTWVDPFFGARVRQQVDQKNAFFVKGDVGGFGAGSRFSWQAAGGYTHDFQFAGFNWTSMIGYRALYVDYSQGSNDRQSGMNAVLHGPTVGVGLRF